MHLEIRCVEDKLTQCLALALKKKKKHYSLYFYFRRFFRAAELFQQLLSTRRTSINCTGSGHFKPIQQDPPGIRVLCSLFEALMIYLIYRGPNQWSIQWIPSPTLGEILGSSEENCLRSLQAPD